MKTLEQICRLLILWHILPTDLEFVLVGNDRYIPWPRRVETDPQVTTDVDYESPPVYDDHIYGNQEPDTHTYGNQEPDDHIYGNQEPDDHIYGNQEPDDHTYGNQKPDGHIYGNQEPDDHIYGNQEPVGKPLPVSDLGTYISEISRRQEGFTEEFSVSYLQISLPHDAKELHRIESWICPVSYPCK